jgi:hypothetical protein
MRCVFKICSEADNCLVYKLNRLRIKCVHRAYPTLRPLLVSTRPSYAMNAMSSQQRSSARNVNSHFAQVVIRTCTVREQGNSTIVRHYNPILKLVLRKTIRSKHSSNKHLPHSVLTSKAALLLLNRDMRHVIFVLKHRITR